MNVWIFILNFIIYKRMVML